jgi:hypothetical protein
MGKAAALMRIVAWPNNLVTLARMLGVSALVGAIALDWPIGSELGTGLFVAAYWLSDYLDGWLARRLGRSSAFGETLDLLADRWCDILLAAFLLRHAPAQTPALIVFLLLRIAPEVIIERFVGGAPGRFTGGLRRFVSPSLAARCMDLGSAAKTIFFAWALFGNPPAWAGLLLVIPAVLFAGFALRVLAELADHSLSARTGDR